MKDARVATLPRCTLRSLAYCTTRASHWALRVRFSAIDRTPSAGLWDGQTDEEELGYSYNEMEKSIRKFRDPETGHIYGNIDMSALTDLDRFVLDRHLSNTHRIVESSRP